MPLINFHGDPMFGVLYNSIRNVGWIHFPGADVGDGAGEYGGKVGKREKFGKNVVIALKVMEKTDNWHFQMIVNLN